MANVNFATGGVLQANLGATDLTQRFPLGARAQGNDGSEWLYVYSTAAITQYFVVYVDSAYQAVPLSLTNAKTAGVLAVAQVAFATAEYGWVMTRGRPLVRLAASCADDVPLFTTDTAGVLDDATASLTQFLVHGILADSSASAGGVQTVSCNATLMSIIRKGPLAYA